MTAAFALSLALSWPTPAPAQQTFRIGLVAQPGEAAGVADLSALKAAYARALGMPVEVVVARDYARLAEAHIEGRIDYAVYSAPAFAAVARRCGCVVPVAAPVDADGAIGLRSVLIVRKDATDGGGRLAVGAVDSLATRLVPLAESAEAREAEAAGRLVEAGSAREAEALFVKGEVDGFFGWVPARDIDGDADGEDADAGGAAARLAAFGLDPSAWRIAWRSRTLRYGPHAVRADMPPERIARLARLLESAGGDGAGGGGTSPGRDILRGHAGFAPVSAGDYRAVEDALAKLGASRLEP